MMNYKNKTKLSLLISLILILTSVSQTIASPTQVELTQTDFDIAIKSGFDYIMTQMNVDGGIRWFDENSSVAATLRTVQALAASQYSQDYLISETEKRPIDFLTENGEAWVNQEETENPGFNVGRAGQLLTAIAAANENPQAFGVNAFNFINAINLTYDVNTGIYGTATLENVVDQVWAMIGLAANNAPAPIEASDWLVSAQLEDGSWNDGFGSFLDTTPLGILALISSGHLDVDSPEIQAAGEFMKNDQQHDGGWQTEWDTITNANTTGVMLQSIYALGQFPENENWQQAEGNPETALLAVQQENGAFGGDFANAFSTAEAIVGLSGRTITDLGYLENASDSFNFLFAAQEPTGGWGTVGQTLDVILALKAAGWEPNSVMQEDGTPLVYVAANLESYLEAGPDAIGKTILGLSSVGIDPTNFQGTDLTQALMDTYDEESMAFGSPDNTWHQALAILGLNAAGDDIPEGSVETLISLQQDDGGWEYTPGFGTWSDNTALAVQALLAAGSAEEDEIIVNALNYIRSMQTVDGGWGDSITTAFVLMALNALDEDLGSWTTESSKDLVSNLFSFQKSNGSFLYNWDYPDDSIMSTAAAMLAVFDGDYLVSPTNSILNHAAIIVDPGDGTIYADCVEFEEDAISGLAMLESSDFSYDAEAGFINSIMNISNPEGETNYWSYWSWNGREWTFKNSGARESTVLPGSIEAWYFTSWETFPSLPSSFVPDINQICGTQVLKNYTDQPQLDYNDLFFVPMVEVEEPIRAATEQPIETPIAEKTDIVEETPEKQEISAPEPENSRSNLPIIIIAVVGTIALVVILVILLRKRHSEIQN